MGWGAAVLAVGLTGVAHAAANVAEKTPLILIPGFTGCSLEVELKNKRSSLPTCPTTTNGTWDIIWMDDQTLNPNNALCFIEDMEVEVHNNQYVTTPGVSIRARGFGSVEGLIYLDLKKKFPSFYGKVVKFFEDHGYTRDVNLFGAPYDWRYSVDRKDTYFKDLQKLVEDTYRKTNLKVALFSHSLGPSITLKFLSMQTTAWKEKYIAAFLAVTPVWAGNVVSVWYAVSGISCKQAWGSNCAGAPEGTTRWFLREVMTNLPSSYWTFPLRGDGKNTSSWNRDEVLIQTPSKKYTAYDMMELMDDLGLDRGKEMCKKVQDLPEKTSFPAPGVDTYVFYGTGTPTPSKFTYSKEFEPVLPGQTPPTATKTEHEADDAGDGVCPLRTVLRSQLAWPEEQAKLNKALEHKGYKGMHHTDTTRMLPDAIKILDTLLATSRAGHTAPNEQL